MTVLTPDKAILLTAWIDQHRDLLKPPVGNAIFWEDAEFIVMIVGGPNFRNDYHVDPAAEIFLQLEGTMILKVREQNGAREIPIAPMNIYTLPALVPHCPLRPMNSVGLVIERKRKEHEFDGFQWYCEQCDNKLYEYFFHLTDIVKELPPIFDSFYNDPKKSTCARCGARLRKPENPSE